MHPQSIPIYLLPFLATTSLAINHPFPRSIDVELIDTATAVRAGITPAPHLVHLDLQQDTTAIRPKHLDLRQNVAAPAAQPAAVPDPGAQAAPAPAAPAAPVAPVPAPAAPAAPVPGVGGGAAPAPAQPIPGAPANPVTMVLVNTVIGGVTTQVSVAFTQTFAAAASAPAVQSGSIGLGTLTGQVGVVKTQNAKSEAVKLGGMKEGLLLETLVISMIVGGLGIGGGVWGLGLL